MSGGQDDTIAYFTGNPRNPGQHRKGVLHVCQSSDTVCVENVPKFILPTEVLAHIATYRADIATFRILGCESNQAQYFIVVRFSGVEKAEAFRAQYNGKHMTALGNEVLFIRCVDAEAGGGVLPRLDNNETAENCPVCLEELHVAQETEDGEQDNGALWTTMCGHTAHMICLQKWDHTNGCPVCRFNPQELGMKCSEEDCNEVDPLWMCLVCGDLGCGRYQKAHAEQHYRTTAHTYCLEVYSGSVWDYAGDGFVHRLVANRIDGKPVAGVDGGDASARHEETLDMEDAKFESHLEGVSDAYSGLLEGQLEAQRIHYEGKLSIIKQEIADTLEPLQKAKEKLAEETEAITRSRTTLKRETTKLRKKLKEIQQKRDALAPDLVLETSLLTQSQANVPKYKEKLDNLKQPSPAVLSKRRTLASLQERLSNLITELES